MAITDFEILSILEEEVKSNTVLHSLIESLVTYFLKFLKEPRFQSPLTISELSDLFKRFYRDLQSVAVNLYTQSNSTKKHLIAQSEYFNSNPKKFDYLLAIASYSTSSIKLVKRSDPAALEQLRIFNYYKFLKVFYSLEHALSKLFDSNTLGEGNSLYEKVFRFDQKDIIHQEFLDSKVSAFKRVEISFEKFHQIKDDKISSFMENLSQNDVAEIDRVLGEVSLCKTPYSKLFKIVKFQKLIVEFLAKAYEEKEINNDLLLPVIVYLLIYKLNPKELYLNFIFVHNFLCLLDPYDIELLPIQSNSSYVPSDRFSKPVQKLIKRSNLFELLNLDESQHESDSNETTDFFNNDKDLIQYISKTFLNNGELSFYLTNFEAVIVFLSNITLSELCPDSSTTNSFLLFPVNTLVEAELASQFEFPEGQASEEARAKDENDKQIRSRSSSLFNTISNKINETRSRSDSSVLNSIKSSNISLQKESFPTLSNDNDSINSPMTEAENSSSFAMMRNIIGRLSSVSVLQFRPSEEIKTQDDGNDGSSAHKRSGSIMNRISPSQARTRSSSMEGAYATIQPQKRNSLTLKLSNGVSEFMTKFNATTPEGTVADSLTTSTSAGNGSATTTIDGNGNNLKKAEDFGRGRTPSLQVMDKWFNNLSNGNNNVSIHQQTNSINTSDESLILSGSISDLMRYQNVEFESLSIKDLMNLKACYDQLCKELSKGSIDENSYVG